MSRKKIQIEDTFSLDDVLNSEEGFANIYIREPTKKKENGMSIKYIGNIEGKLGVATKRIKRVVPNLQHVRIRTSEEEEEMLVSKNKNFMGSNRILVNKKSLPNLPTMPKGLSIPNSKYSLTNFNFIDIQQFKENSDRKSTPMTNNMNLNATGKNFSPGNIYNGFGSFSGHTSMQNSDNHANIHNRIELTDEKKLFYNTTRRFKLHMNNKVNTVNLHEDLLQDINYEVKNLNLSEKNSPEKQEKEKKNHMYSTNSSQFYKSAKKNENLHKSNLSTGRNYSYSMNSPLENNLLMSKTYFKGEHTNSDNNTVSNLKKTNQTSNNFFSNSIMQLSNNLTDNVTRYINTPWMLKKFKKKEKIMTAAEEMHPERYRKHKVNLDEILKHHNSSVRRDVNGNKISDFHMKLAVGVRKVGERTKSSKTTVRNLNNIPNDENYFRKSISIMNFKALAGVEIVK
jgi:hypothetical protein